MIKMQNQGANQNKTSKTKPAKQITEKTKNNKEFKQNMETKYPNKVSK